MKSLSALVLLVILETSCFSQSPNSFKYQAVLRDKTGQLIVEKVVSVRISILQGTVNGTSVFSETHSPKTSGQGVVNLEIGKGTLAGGTFSSIAWGTNAHFIKVEMDPAGGSAYDLVGTSQLLSVPYAMHAQTSGDEKWTGVTGGINYNNGNVGIGTLNPTSKLDIKGSGELNLLNLSNENNSLGVNFSVASLTDFHASALIGRRSRGTLFAPQTPVSGDRITGFYGSYYANSSFQNPAAIQMYVGSNPGASSYPANIRFETTGPNETARTERMRISDLGNIGIGISNPLHKLDVAGGINASQLLINGSPISTPWSISGSSILYNGGNVGIGTSNPLYKLDVSGSVNASQLLLNGSPLSAVSPWSLSGSSAFYNNGNVGIGTSSPGVKLEINGGGVLNLLDLRNDNNSLGINAFVASDTDFHGSAFIGRRSRGTGANPTLALAGDRITGIYGSLYADGNYQNASAIHMYVGSNPGASSYPVNIRFETTNSNETTRTERMRISENGNIGIGTSIPKSKLQIENGDVYISSVTSGVIMKSPNGSCWRMTVNDSGVPVFSAISCP